MSHCVGAESEDKCHGKIYDHLKKYGATSVDTTPLIVPVVMGVDTDCSDPRNKVEVVEKRKDVCAVCERSANSLHESNE